jgi:cellulose 1,4-beta-cellobiosidase
LPNVSAYAGAAGSNYYSTGGSYTWSTTSPATGAPDSSYANSASLGSGYVTESLDLYDFNPSLPSGSTVTGIEIVITAKKSSSRAVSFDGAVLTIGGTTGTPTTTSANGTALTTSSATYQYGSSTDLWGFSSGTLTVANINSAVEGTGPTLSVWFEGGGGASASTAQVDAVQITVYYTTGSVPGAPTLGVAGDSTNPTTSLDLTITAGTGSPTSFVIQRSTTGIGGTFTTLASGVTGTTYTDTLLTPGTEYAYQVAGTNGSGTGSYCSPVAWATVSAAPTLSTTGNTTTSVSLAVTPPSVGGTISVLDYVYRIESPVGAGNWSTPSSWSGLTMTGLAPGSQYGVEAAAVLESSNGDWAGTIQSAWSSELTVYTASACLPARCNVIMARVITGFEFRQF